MSLIVIKLGGSVVTYKNNHTPKPRFKVIRNISKEILSLHKKGYKIILVHGGGSYGHNLAKKYNLTKGLKTENSHIGLVKTVQSMSKLNFIIVDILEKIGLPAISFPSHSFITQTNGNLNEFDPNIVKDVLNLGFIPVLYGDGVYDEKLGCSIISGDTIATYLAKKLNAKKVIFLSDVDGILDGTKLIPLVNNKNLNEVLKKIKIKNHKDITGEMKGKILSIKKSLPGKKVSIINGLVEGNLTKVILGKVAGTKILFE